MTTGPAANAKPAPDPATSGLEGIVAARTPLSELDEQNQRLVSYRRLPDEARSAVQLAAKRMEPMDALRYAVAALTADDPAPGDISHEVNQQRAEMIVARV